MDLPVLLTFVAICLASVSGHTIESHAEAYWKAKLGNTPIPKVVMNSLKGLQDEAVNANPTIDNGDNKVDKYARIQTTNIKKFDSIETFNTKVVCLFSYQRAAPRSTDPKFLHDDLAEFFLEKYLTHPGGKVKLHFSSDDQSKFLPLQVAKSVPFSYSKLSEILNLFSVKPDSIDAKIVEETIKVCEARPVKGDHKNCTTSLEAMVDYVISTAGSQVKVFSTTIEKETTMEYRVEKAQKLSNNVSLVCHKMNYPYAVFYCHNHKKTDAYVVSLVDANGKKNKAIAVCHQDTSSWNAEHLAFQLLKVKPGSVPICHFLGMNVILWTRN